MVISARVPRFWMLFLTRYLQSSPRLARLLWKHYRPACPTTATWYLARVDKTPTLETMAPVAQELLTPAALMAAIERAYPPGSRRPQEVIDLEETILARTDRAGHWR